MDFVDRSDNDAVLDLVALLLELGDKDGVVDNDNVPVDLGLRVIWKDTRGDSELRDDKELVADDVELGDDLVEVVGDSDDRGDAVDTAVFVRVFVAVAVFVFVSEEVAVFVEVIDLVAVDDAVAERVSIIPTFASLRG